MIDKQINKFKKQLTKKAIKSGIYENFGQKEINKLKEIYKEHKYNNDGIWDKITIFQNWCMNFNMTMM